MRKRRQLSEDSVRFIVALLISFGVFTSLILMSLPPQRPDPVEIIKEVQKEIEVIKYVEVPTEVVVEIEREALIDVSSVERELVTRTVWREVGNCSLECQKAVASVIFNRMKDGYWGDDVASVIYAPGQFHVAHTLGNATPQEISYESVDAVIFDGVTLPDYVMYFNGGDPVWRDGYHDYIIIDGVHFGYYEKDITKG